MLGEALSFPRNHDGATQDLLVGGGLVLASPLVFPALFLWGYLLDVMDAAARGRDEPPGFGDWGALALGGLRAAVVSLVYGLVPLGLFAGPPAGAWFALGLRGLRALTHPQLAVVLVVVALLWLLALLLVLHLPAALVAVATQGTLAAAFRSEALWAVVNTKAYLVGVVVAALVLVVGSLVGVLLIPVVLVGFVALFYVQVVVAYLLGRAVGGAAVTAIEPA